MKKLSGRFIVWCSLRFCRMQHKGQPLLPWPFQSILVHVSPGYGCIYLDLHFLSDETCASICSHCKKKSKSIIFFSYKTADYQCKLKAWLMMINLSFSKRFGDLIFNPSLVKKKKSPIKRCLAILYHKKVLHLSFLNKIAIQTDAKLVTM